MECYNCKTELGPEETCPRCGTNVKMYKKLIAISNGFYNMALERAKERDLAGAVEALKTSFQYYKMNIQARNLLGLVYFEMGETVSALSEWVLSKNFKEKDNLADRYLSDVQSNQSLLSTTNQTIKKYNQALQYCRQGNTDLAITGSIRQSKADSGPPAFGAFVYQQPEIRHGAQIFAYGRKN